jgi:hypothetical protein
MKKECITCGKTEDEVKLIRLKEHAFYSDECSAEDIEVYMCEDCNNIKIFDDSFPG